MKKRISILPALMALICFCFSCSGIGGSSDDDSGVRDLSLREQVAGTIKTVGEVDWYRFKAVESNNVLQVKCTSETLRPDVDLLVGLYRLDASGTKTLIYADHATDGGLAPANLTIHTYIDTPQDIYIAVRDLLDDDASENKYYVSVDFSGSAEENDNFTTASNISVDSGTGPSDSISYVGDVDCFQFTSTGGIYDVNVVFSPFDGTSVQLEVDLFNEFGELVSRNTSLSSNDLHLIHYLPEGTYYINVDDAGMDNFDNASTYQVLVNSVSSGDMYMNDTLETAETVNLIAYGEATEMNASVDYIEDQDWYNVSFPTSTGGFQVLDISLGSTDDNEFTLNILDENGESLLSHDYRGQGNMYQTSVKLPGNACYVIVQPSQNNTLKSQAAYSLNLIAKNVLDTAEVSPNNNDTINTADPISANVTTSGMIGYRGDVDWYSITVPPHSRPQILEVFLEAPLSRVQYAVSVIGDGILKKIYNADPENIPTRLKTSVLIPDNSSAAVYSFRVGDFQDEDGDDAIYSIRADIQNIPVSLPEVAASAPPYGEIINYVDEGVDANGGIVTLEYNPVTQKSYGFDATLLDAENAIVEQNTPSTGLTRMTFPWIAGYIDYQEDQDWFRIDFQPLDVSDDWYYEIQVDFYAPQSDVEYVWKFYPDRNDNNTVADRTSEYDGYIACSGDLTILEDVVNISTPSNDDAPFWVGSAWQGPAFFSISDFNYLYTAPGERNTSPDDDWGNYGSAPYYFKVTLIYHPGEAYP